MTPTVSVCGRCGQPILPTVTLPPTKQRILMPFAGGPVSTATACGQSFGAVPMAGRKTAKSSTSTSTN